METVIRHPVTFGFRRLFLAVTPNETSFEKLEDVPNYVEDATPYFFSLIVIEWIILYCQGKPLPRPNDSFGSLSNGVLSIFHGLLFRGTEIAAYIWMYNKFNLVQLPWDNPITWLVCLIGVDFGYYWVHRAGHDKPVLDWTSGTSQFRGVQPYYSPTSVCYTEVFNMEINLFWTGHQAHHSSEEYNLTTALRQSAILKYLTWCTYIMVGIVHDGMDNEYGQISLASEVNFMWAGHQVHHSSEDYNLATALRQSMYHRYTNWFFYMPLALFIPPSIFLVHIQFNLLYQFWIHTETIDRLGPLEWILSTPSHHRVHHGRNPYCIDKNYGGVFIVWDRLFGTFEEEKRDEKVVYGLVHNIDTWEPLYAQLFHLVHVVKTAWSIEGFSNKMSVILKGPGWSPGKPRLGLHEEIPQVEQNPNKYDTNLPLWNAVYVWIHFLLIIGVWHPSLGMYKKNLTTWSMVRNIAFLTWSLSLFGAMYDKKYNAALYELLRCLVYVIWVSFTNDVPLGMIFMWLYVPSTLLWLLVVLTQRGQKGNGAKKLD